MAGLHSFEAPPQTLVAQHQIPRAQAQEEAGQAEGAVSQVPPVVRSLGAEVQDPQVHTSDP